MSGKVEAATGLKEKSVDNGEKEASEDPVPVGKKTSSKKAKAKSGKKPTASTDSIPETEEEQNDEENKNVDSAEKEKEATPEEKAEEPTVEPAQKPKEADEDSDSTEEEKMPPKRGKQPSKKNEAAEPVETATAAQGDSVGEEPIAKAKTARKPATAAKGKKGKKEEVIKEAEEEQKVEENEKMEEEAAKPEEKEDEEMKNEGGDKEAEEEEEPAKPAPKGRGGRKAVGAKPVEMEDDREAEEEIEAAKPAPMGRGGRKAAAAKPATGEEPETKKQKKEDKPAAKGRGKKTAEKVEEEKEESNEEEEKEEVEEEAKPKGRGRAAAKKMEAKAEKEEEPEPEKVSGRPKRGAATKAAATAKKIAEDEEEEEVKPKRGVKGAAKKAAEKGDEEEKPAAAKRGGKQPAKGRGKGKKEAVGDEDGPSSKKVKVEEDEEMDGKSGVKSMTKSIRRTVQVKGKAAVDPLCTRKTATAHVYEAGELIYDVMLNQTNIGNNNNKFYVIQLLEDDKDNHYSVWNRWGRVGYDGQSKLTEFGPNLQMAIKEFASKFEAKTKNQWPTAFADFETYYGKYTMIEMDYGNGGGEGDVKIEKEQEEEEKQSKAVSKLDHRVQQLMHLMCSIRNMTLQVKQLEFDADKSPLGKLTQQQIKEGFACLGKIEKFILDKDFGSAFKDAVNEYYTKVPHACGFRPPAMIKTPQLLKNEIELLDLLAGIEYAIKTMKEEKRDEDVHPVDRHYASLKCGLSPMEKNEMEYELVEEYLAKTRGATHSINMKLKNAFKVEREGEDENEKVMEKIGNRKLLWHGSRLSNFFGILSQGLRIAPPEAPSTGYMFGKGVYFADMATKSGNYCNVSEDGQTAFLLLAEVALGEENQLSGADYDANKLPSGKHSTWGLGRTMPDPAQDKKLNDKVVVPCGKPSNSPFSDRAGLLYNEFIVYNTQQIRMRYLLEVEFNFI